ncbi:LysR family transcriptional regulator [Sphingomonas oleivorans]|uniref:LysR family transcriptional regulator n=1 Tax=Sphingomonas oleivorans TaxID=1735121 RepID=A0A2T5G278_9SPHN|nr:LysR family transcriptional regulator [Sphingomonas oleivorans]PTQ13257.1 LysR family transcriptional regulator [Sphingomonas oleivorans]
MSDDVPDWEDQRAFLAVIESGSLSGASRQLNVAQPTVRRRMEALERALGIALFTRSTNGLAPTEQALALAQHVRAMASASRAFVRAASAPAGMVAGTVRISAAEVVGTAVLPPMLASLRRKHPDLSVELSLTNMPEDLLHQEVDIAIRMHRPHQAALVARRIGVIGLGFFAHRDYVARHGLPASLAELSQFDLIGSDRTVADLRLTQTLGEGLDRTAFALRTDSHPAQLAAIRAGFGIGITHIALGRNDPDLVAILPDFVVHGIESWVVMHEDLRRLARVRAAFDHLVEQLSRYAQSA